MRVLVAQVKTIALPPLTKQIEACFQKGGLTMR